VASGSAPPALQHLGRRILSLDAQRRSGRRRSRRSGAKRTLLSNARALRGGWALYSSRKEEGDDARCTAEPRGAYSLLSESGDLDGLARAAMVAEDHDARRDRAVAEVR